MILLDNKGHLNEEGIAVFAEGLIDSEAYKRIPAHLLDHIDSCMECKQKVLEIYEILKDDNEIMEKIRLKTFQTDKKLKPSAYRIAKTFPKYSLTWWLAAASIIVMFGLYFIFRSYQNPVNERLFSEYFSPYQNLLTMKGDQDQALSEAMYFYDMKQWDSAAYYFDRTGSKDLDQSAISFYYGNVLLASGQTAEAEKLFLKIISGNDDRFLIQAKWYLALTYLKSGNTGKSVGILIELKSSQGVYGQRARELLNELDQ